MPGGSLMETLQRYDLHWPNNTEFVCVPMPDGYWTPWHIADHEVTRLKIEKAELLEALEDMLSGWRYIRQQHGDLYGVGWDRAQDKAESAIAKARGFSIRFEIKLESMTK
jgi:hypothetical protein